MLVPITRPLNDCLRRVYLTQNLKYISTTTCLKTVNSESSAYAGVGRTIARVINNEDQHLNVVNSYAPNGFRLSSNLFITGSMILFPTHIFSWAVKRGRDITTDSLRIFDLIVPKVKIVVIGYGDESEPYDESLRYQLKKKGISCELLPTSRACATYNFLLSDAVHVAGAFVTVNKRDVRVALEHEKMEQEDSISDAPLYVRSAQRDTLEYYKTMKHIKKDLPKDV